MNSLDVNPHVVPPHEQLGTVGTRYTRSALLTLLLGDRNADTGLGGLLHLARSHGRSEVLTHNELTGLDPAVVDDSPAVYDWYLLPSLQGDAGHGLLHSVGLDNVHLLLLLLLL